MELSLEIFVMLKLKLNLIVNELIRVESGVCGDIIHDKVQRTISWLWI